MRKAYQNSNPYFHSGITLTLIHIPQVKPEFRVLGVTAGNYDTGYLVIGSVFRGNKELDGVLSARGEHSIEEIIAGMLSESKHRGQVRLIFMDQKNLPEQVDPVEIWEKTGKPVLVKNETNVFDSRFMFRYLDSVFIAAGIDEESAKRVLDKIYPESHSEALRVAGIILESILGLHKV